MMRCTLLLACYFALSFQTTGQIILGPEGEKLIKSPFEVVDQGWEDRGAFSINSTQTYLSHWASGGNSAFNLTGLLNYGIFYRDNRHSWDNIINAAYGRSVIELNQPSVKTDDKLDVTTKYGWRAKYNWSYTAMINFKTQFAGGYVSGARGLPDVQRGKISDWLSPAYFTAALGMDYLQQRKITCFISPFTGKGTIVKNQRLADMGQFGVKPAIQDNEGNIIIPGENLRIEYGAYIRLGISKSWKEQYRMDTKLELFSSYLNNPQNIDFNMESVLNCKINKFLGFSLTMQMIYDDDIVLIKQPAGFDQQGNPTKEIKGPGLQFKEVLGIGFQYSL
jgi:hypothetical protein